jgi:pimeloyl-ACP methyl ester carboxylesterase
MSSRLARHPDDHATAALGVRLITVDRAGIGRSDPDPAKTLLSAAEDVGALAEELGLERFAVLGHSGGGPYALACAWAFPERVSRVGIASGFAPFDRPDPYAGMSARMRGFVKLLRRAPWLAGVFMRRAASGYRKDPAKAFAQQFGELSEPDRSTLAAPRLRQNLLESAVEALAGGYQGAATESQLLFVRPWGFSPTQVTCPVELWYGAADTIVPQEMGVYLHDTLPDARLTVLPDAGHTLYLTHWAEILRSLTSAPDRSHPQSSPSASTWRAGTPR